MADEISIGGHLLYKKGSRDIERFVRELFVDQSGGDYIEASQDVTTTEAALDIGNIGTVGWCYFYNPPTTGANTATNIIIRFTTEVDAIRLKPGEFALFRSADDTIFVDLEDGGATSATLEYLIIEA